jgi:protein required for attachment to host cells
MKRVLWLATFDGASARLFAIDREAERCTPVDIEVADGPHRQHFEDRPTTTHQSVGARRGSGDLQTDPERAVEDRFVKALAENLARRAEAGAFEQIVIAAGPRALGAFRAAAPPSLKSRVKDEIAKDLVNEPAANVYARIADLL